MQVSRVLHNRSSFLLLLCIKKVINELELKFLYHFKYLTKDVNNIFLHRETIIQINQWLITFGILYTVLSLHTKSIVCARQLHLMRSFKFCIRMTCHHALDSSIWIRCQNDGAQFY